MEKIITLDPQHKHKEGIDEVVNLIKQTIGPKGRNICLTNGEIVNDGKRIAEDITLSDQLKAKGANKVRQLVRRISTDVGGGRTACAILYQALVDKGLKLLDKGHNLNEVKKGMFMAVKDIHKKLDDMSQPAEGKLKEVATISTESEELGTIIATTLNKIGLDSVITVETSNSFGITAEIAEGLKFDKGFISPYMITNDRKEAIYEDIPVLITDRKISFFKDIKPIIDDLIKEGVNNLLIIAEDVEGEALNAVVFGKIKGLFNVLAIKTPGVGDLKKYVQEDLCALTGAELWNEYTKKPKLGVVKKVQSSKDYTILQGKKNMKGWIETLKTMRSGCENEWEKDQYDERIAKLTNGIAIIKVGAASEDEVKYLKLKIEDGVNEAKRALEEGIVPGGNVSLVHAAKDLVIGSESVDRVLGYNIVLESVEFPLRQIIENAGGKPDIFIDQIPNGNSVEGYNANTNTWSHDLIKDGIIDATKVVKSILQYAVAEAAIFLSIGGDVSKEVKEE